MSAKKFIIEKISNNKLNSVLAAASLGATVYASKQNNESAIKNTAIESAKMSLLTPVGYVGLKAVSKGVPKVLDTSMNIMREARAIGRERNKAFGSGTFVDNPQYFTMRQAGMSAIEQQKYDLQNAEIGNEAMKFNRR